MRRNICPTSTGMSQCRVIISIKHKFLLSHLMIVISSLISIAIYHIRKCAYTIPFRSMWERKKIRTCDNAQYSHKFRNWTEILFFFSANTEFVQPYFENVADKLLLGTCFSVCGQFCNFVFFFGCTFTFATRTDKKIPFLSFYSLVKCLCLFRFWWFYHILHIDTTEKRRKSAMVSFRKKNYLVHFFGKG